ncbi:hypothetical protein HUX53_33750 [Actinomadura sp. BRA 177]|nr:hypothetical protein [Actinomadura sp. BRA 177]
MCTENAVSVPVSSVPVAGPEGPTSAEPSQGLHGLVGAALTAPVKPSPQMPLDVCLCAAVLFTLLLLALFSGLRRPFSRLPARTGWSLGPPPGAASVPAFPPVLQVLRL